VGELEERGRKCQATSHRCRLVFANNTRDERRRSTGRARTAKSTAIATQTVTVTVDETLGSHNLSVTRSRSTPEGRTSK